MLWAGEITTQSGGYSLVSLPVDWWEKEGGGSTFDVCIVIRTHINLLLFCSIVYIATDNLVMSTVQDIAWFWFPYRARKKSFFPYSYWARQRRLTSGKGTLTFPFIYCQKEEFFSLFYRKKVRWDWRVDIFCNPLLRAFIALTWWPWKAQTKATTVGLH